MSYLAVSDLHFGLKQYDWLLLEARRHEAVLIAGDLLDISGHLELDEQIVVVTEYLRRLSRLTRVFVCSGNHDGDVRDEAQEYRARWLAQVRAEGLCVDGRGCDLGAVRISVCPWWDGPASQAELAAFLREEKQRRGEAWLWLHHAPPDGVGVSWTGKGHAGDADLVRLIEELRPDYVVSGHIHHSPFTAGGGWVARVGTTWSFNPGKQLGAPPAHIVLDLPRRSARWSSQAGEEAVDLAASEVRVQVLA